uniref:Ring finger protein 4 n=1 Tax=Leptobrachium leishanense TaxID=445787 RepID=A0A8C5LSD8_9ANUR
MSATQRKRKSANSSNSRNTRKRRAGQSSTTAMATSPETIEVEEGGEEVVDLTCESYEPVVVDLTRNDSVVVIKDNSSQTRNSQVSEQASSCILSSDEEDSRDTDVFVSSRVSGDTSTAERDGSRFSAGKVSCPICLDGYSERCTPGDPVNTLTVPRCYSVHSGSAMNNLIIKSRRLIVSTKCGHIFCSQCIRDSLKSVSSCPTCRKKLTPKQYHPIYI